MAGYYRLPKEYIMADLKLLPEGLHKPFTKLLQEGLIKYCEKSSVILIPNYYKYNPIQNKNQAKGAAKRPANCLEIRLLKIMKSCKHLCSKLCRTVAERVTQTV